MRGWEVAAAFLALLALTCFGAALLLYEGEPLPRTESLPSAAPMPRGEAATVGAAGSTARRHSVDRSPAVVRSAVAAPRPVALRAPAIDLSVTSIPGLGLNADGTVEVPTNPDEAGWYRLGPPPGQMGSAVILGHVDSIEGPAVFARLQYLQTDDRVAVSLSDGTVARFVVDRVRMFANAEFPARKVYASSSDASALRLVTCGGEYDEGNGGYQSNVVVFASMV